MAPATNTLTNDRGSTVIESLLVTLFLVSAVSGGLCIMYLSFARVWVDRSTYEGVICLASDTPARECERRFKTEVETALPIGHLTRARFTQASSFAQVETSFSIEGIPVLHRREKIVLPLRSGLRGEWW